VILVDTSVLVDLLRHRLTPPVERLRRLELDGIPFAIPSICCQEVLQGAKDESDWETLIDNLHTQRIVFPADPWSTHVAAARLYFDCRRRGITLRSTIDCLIAQQALENEATLLHDDDDFERMREVRPLKALRS
jgi:hypothetical protein